MLALAIIRMPDYNYTDMICRGLVLLWNICLAQKQRRNGAFLNGGCRYFVKKIEYREFQK